jgi:hypothetical protein
MRTNSNKLVVNEHAARAVGFRFSERVFQLSFFFQIILGFNGNCHTVFRRLLSAFTQPYPSKRTQLLTDLVADPPNLFILVLHPRIQQSFHSVFMALHMNLP